MPPPLSATRCGGSLENTEKSMSNQLVIIHKSKSKKKDTSVNKYADASLLDYQQTKERERKKAENGEPCIDTYTRKNNVHQHI
jgi:hypothetical protein